jgi:hypothetical protein
MRSRFYPFFFFVFFVWVPISTIGAQVNKPVGINLTGIKDWSTELVFTDAFKQSRAWISYNAAGGGPWDTQIPIPMNVNGYPLQIPYTDGNHAPQAIRTLMLWDLQGAYPSGNYRLLVSGTGTVTLSGAASGTFNAPCDVLVPVNAANGGIILSITQSLVTDPIQQIQFIMPDYIETYGEQTFTQEFLEFVEDFECIRFMDWMETNHSPVSTWSQRPSYGYYTQTTHSGVAYEYIADLCNLTMKDAWICVPHQADDEYILQLATLFRDQLHPNLRIYIEYSNEVWNGIFSQHHYAIQQGNALFGTGNNFGDVMRWIAKRSADVFQIFQSTFGGTQRLVRVLPSWAATMGWYSNELLQLFYQPAFNPSGVGVDAIAIAPYFGGSIADQIVAQGEVNTISVAEIINRLQVSLSESFAEMDAAKSAADNFNIALIAYEGGQHLVATGANTNNTTLTNLLIAANRHPAMEDLYCQYAQHWYEETHSGLFAFFSSHGLPSRWGSWGVKEHMHDVDNPKYLGLVNCVFDQTFLSLTWIHLHSALRNDGSTQLVWRITADQDIRHYQVQISEKGKRWSNIGSEVDHIENRDVYSLMVDIPQGKYRYFRIQAMDIRGELFYSPTATLPSIQSEDCLLYPNPASDFIELTCNHADHKKRLSIKHISGKTMFQGVFSNNRVDISDLPSGIYILSLDGATWKFVKN